MSAQGKIWYGYSGETIRPLHWVGPKGRVWEAKCVVWRATSAVVEKTTIGGEQKQGSSKDGGAGLLPKGMVEQATKKNAMKAMKASMKKAKQPMKAMKAPMEKAMKLTKAMKEPMMKAMTAQ